MKNLLILILVIFLVCFLIVFWIWHWAWQEIYLPKSSQSSQEKLFSFKKGENLFQLAENLRKGDLIKNKIFFEIYVISKGKIRNLQAGEYLLSPSLTIPEITEKFVSGDTIKEKITIVEGWNLRDTGFYFENKGMFQAEELWELVGFPAIDYSKTTDLPEPKDFSQEYDFLKDKPKNAGLEGYLFPDTYFFNNNTFSTTVENASSKKLEMIVRKMLDNFGKKLTPDLRKEIKGQKKTIFEIITMASLLEKEVRTIEDKKLVSGILWKRLKNKMPLQVDATIIYITGRKTTDILISELQIDSPYNTYKYQGLPLGPISNPGLDSISAAVYSEISDYWFYLSTPEGKTIFSKTLAEHNIAKAKYLK